MVKGIGTYPYFGYTIFVLIFNSDKEYKEWVRHVRAYPTFNKDSLRLSQVHNCKVWRLPNAVQEGSRMFKKVQEGSRGFQEGSRRFKKVQDGSRIKGARRF